MKSQANTFISDNKSSFQKLCCYFVHYTHDKYYPYIVSDKLLAIYLHASLESFRNSHNESLNSNLLPGRNQYDLWTLLSLNMREMT